MCRLSDKWRVRGMLFLGCVMAALPGVAVAHSSLESTVSGVVKRTGIEMQLYVSRGNAAVLLEKPGEHVTILRENFGAFEKRLGEAGAAQLTLSSEGMALVADAASAELTDEDDICFRLHYPLPRSPALTIRGNYLAKMEDGHAGGMYVVDAAGNTVGQGEIRADSPELEVRLPADEVATAPSDGAASATAPASLTGAALAVARPGGTTSGDGSRWWLWGLLGVGVVAMVLLALRTAAAGGRSEPRS